MEHESDSPVISAMLEAIEYAAIGIEVLAVVTIVVGTLGATLAFLTRTRQRFGLPTEYVRYRVRLGRTLLLGLEILVAADVIRTVALDPSLESVAFLGLLVIVRTFLSWSLEVEMEHRWPWQQPSESQAFSSGPNEPSSPDFAAATQSQPIATETQAGPAATASGKEM